MLRGGDTDTDQMRNREGGGRDETGNGKARGRIQVDGTEGQKWLWSGCSLLCTILFSSLQ